MSVGKGVKIFRSAVTDLQGVEDEASKEQTDQLTQGTNELPGTGESRTENPNEGQAC